MCGRVSLHTPDIDTLARQLEARVADADRDRYRPRYNVAPTQGHWIVLVDDHHRRLVPATWGLRVGRHLAINARAETIRAKFRAGFQGGRCLVPATGFYEWSGDRRNRHPTWFSTPDGLLLLAGVTQPDAAPEQFTIITVPANRLVGAVHDRMPAVLTPEAAARWLGRPDASLLTPAPEDALVARRVSDRANSAMHDDPSCIEPRPPEPGQLSLLDEPPQSRK